MGFFAFLNRPRRSYRMHLAEPRNALILTSLAVHAQGKTALERHDAVPPAVAYSHCGCHSDVVARLWDQINPVLPDDCRRLLFGTPALVHPGGLILALGMGTGYGIRILPSTATEAAAAGVKTINFGSGGAGMDIRQSYGPDWVFGSWLAQEDAWCQAVYAARSSAEHLLVDPSLRAKAEEHDYAAIAAEEMRAHQAKLEQLAAAGDREATFKLFEVLMNAAFKQRSWALMERADALLSEAASGGHGKALAIAAAWPHLQAEAKRQFPNPAPPDVR